MSIFLYVELCTYVYSFIVSPDIPARLGRKQQIVFQVEVLNRECDLTVAGMLVRG